MQVRFVISNPGHHLAAAVPVARELVARGHRPTVVSLCELRGYPTPIAALDAEGLEVVRVIPLRLRRSPDVSWARGLARRPLLLRWARRAVESVWLRPRLARALPPSTDVAVLPNDAVFPFTVIVGLLRRRRTPFLLLQEGIRFPQPGVAAADTYGRGGAAAIAAWGDSSAEHFRDLGVAPETVQVTGSPRLDDLDPSRAASQGTELLARLGVDGRPLLFLSNPIETQGLCSATQKLELFRRFLVAAGPLLGRWNRWLIVKLHPGESETEFRRVAAASSYDRIVVTGTAPLHPLLAVAGQAVVLASTVGVEAICFGVPLGVLEIPGHGFAFDYVDSGVAQPLRLDRLEDDLRALCDASPDPLLGERYLERAVAGRRGSSERIAELIERLGSAAA